MIIIIIVICWCRRSITITYNIEYRLMYIYYYLIYLDDQLSLLLLLLVVNITVTCFTFNSFGINSWKNITRFLWNVNQQKYKRKNNCEFYIELPFEWIAICFSDGFWVDMCIIETKSFSEYINSLWIMDQLHIFCLKRKEHTENGQHFLIIIIIFVDWFLFSKYKATFSRSIAMKNKQYQKTKNSRVYLIVLFIVYFLRKSFLKIF